MNDAGPLTQSDWECHLKNLLPLFGHRNWIMVADSAYPAQAKAAIETILADAKQIDVVSTVLAAITAARRVRANVGNVESENCANGRSAIAAKARSTGVDMILAPVLDLARDPRWGRVESCTR